jgi:phytoene desaturase (3,4-didehydrolycopene-forming)
LLLLRDEYESLFADCANNIDTLDFPSPAEKYGLSMKQCIPAYQVVFDDGDTVDLGFPRSKCVSATLSVEDVRKIQMQEQKSIQQLNSIEEDGFQKWQGYLDTCAAFLDCGLPNFIEEKLDLKTLPKFLIESLKDNASRWPLQPHSTMLSNLFSSPKMIALASFQDLYVGLEPFVNDKQIGGGVLRKTAPAVFGLLAALELHPTNPKCGVFAPIGGFRQVAESMHRLCEDCGVKFEFDASVTRVDSNGVHLKSTEGKTRFFSADVIICNADLPYATQSIVSNDKDHDQSTAERYDWDVKFDYSTGVIAFHWSVSKEMVPLNTHNVFMSAKSESDAKNSWSVLRVGTEKQMTNEFSADQPFNFYVHRAGKTDPTASPPGCDAIMVLVPCAPLKRDKRLALLPRDESINLYKQQFDDKVVSSVREAVFERLGVVEGLEDFRRYILNEVIDTPGVYSDYYNLGAGVPFGLSHGLSQLSLTRPSVECSSYDNVLYVGGECSCYVNGFDNSNCLHTIADRFNSKHKAWKWCPFGYDWSQECKWEKRNSSMMTSILSSHAVVVITGCKEGCTKIKGEDSCRK